MNHTELLNYLSDKIHARSYLEIGVQNKANNFSLIRTLKKTGVDPDPRAGATFVMSSDKFFSINREKFDLIFIDGLHHAAQVERDFENSLSVLRDGGVIVIHDTNPDSEDITHVPRDRDGPWMGDVYKFVCKLNERSDICFQTLLDDCGCTVVWREDKEATRVGEITWEAFDNNRWMLRPVREIVV